MTDQDGGITDSDASLLGPDRLRRLLDLEELDRDLYRGWNPPSPVPRVFGGQVAAQALVAAARTVPEGRWPHSLHAYFMRPGRPGVPIVFFVDRLRDGRSFTTRAVVAKQGGEAIFNLSASFHVDEDGEEFQLPMAEAPGPDTLDAAPEMRMWAAMSPFEMRTAPIPPGSRSTRRVWLRTRDRLPDDRMLHACVLTFLSDMGVVSAARAPTASGWERFMGASLDHAVWFHRPIRADEWFLFDLEAVSNHGARGLARGFMHAADGTLGVSVNQEALLRPTGGPPSGS